MEPQAVLWLLAFAGVVLGVLGCAFGIRSWRRERSLQQRLDRLQQAAARQAKRARLRAILEQQVEISWTVIIQNDAPAAANGITISINGVPLERSPLVHRKKLEHDVTEAIAGNGQLRLPLVMRERPEELVVEITWSDASGDLGFNKMTLAASSTSSEHESITG